jgi:Tol biopolymer transport system component
MAENVVQDTYAGLGTFSVSEGGSLVYRSAVTESRELARLDRSGRRLGTVGKPGDYTQIALSPDEKSVALIVNNGAQSDIWLEDIARGETQDWIIDWMGKNLK